MTSRPAKLVCAKCGGELVAGSRFCNQCGAPAPATSPFEILEDGAVAPIRPGDVLEGKWRVEKKIGQGGMGSVYRATDLALDRVVAVKVLAAELCKDEVFVARFEREAKLTAGLEQPNVVLIYGVGRHLGRPFIVMKWLAGQTLSRRLDAYQDPGRRMSVAEVRSIVTQICAGLDYIHRQGLVHRDIKASNIILDDTNHATILDFGILRDLNSDEALTAVGILIGTPHYVSPEQILGKPFDARSDLYAVGVLLYEMLTGATPFDADNEFDLIKMHVKQAPPDPCARNPELPPQVGKVLRRAIAKDVAKRYQTAGELAEAFEQAFAEADEAEAELHRSRTLPMSRPTAPLQAGTRLAMEAQPSSRRALWAGMALGVLVSVAAAALAYINFFQPEAPPLVAPEEPLVPMGPKRPTLPQRRPLSEDPEVLEEEEYEDEGAGEAEPARAGGGADAEGDSSEEETEPASLLKKAIEEDPSRLDALRRRAK